MSDPRLAVLDEMLRDVRKKLVTANDEVARLRTVESYVTSELQALGHYSDSPINQSVQHTFTIVDETQRGNTASVKRLRGLPKHEAAAAVLEMLAKPASVPEIADFMISHLYGTNLSRKVLLSSIRTAMDRKTDTFVLGDNSKWRLVKWADNPVEA